MTGQVIGFFENRSEAEQVRNELLHAGFDRDEVDLFAGTGKPGQPEEPSFMDHLKRFFGVASDVDQAIYAEAARRGEIAVAVDADDEKEIDRAAEIMEKHHAIDLERQAQEWRAQGWTPLMPITGQPPSQPRAARPQAGGQEEVLPVTEEELRVGKREIRRGGIRIHSRVTERPVAEKVELREEHVSVERRPADRPVSPTDKAFQERTVEMTEKAEEPVVSKQAKVVEEVAIRKDVQQRTETIRDTVRRTDVQVEQLTPEQESKLADTFVEDLSREDRYRGRDWKAIEPDAQRDFERRHTGRNWDQFRDRIRSAYERRIHRP